MNDNNNNKEVQEEEEQSQTFESTEATTIVEQVLHSPPVFAAIAEFATVEDLVAVSHASYAMYRAVNRMSHWECDRVIWDSCEDTTGRIFSGSGLPSSCAKNAKKRGAPSCTQRCKSCKKTGGKHNNFDGDGICESCSLLQCDRCDSWYHTYRGLRRCGSRMQYVQRETLRTMWRIISVH